MQYLYGLCLLGGCLGILSGCSSQVSSDHELPSSTQQRIVDGVPTTDPALNAVGGIVFKYAPAHYQEFSCTGTLIAPKSRS